MKPLTKPENRDIKKERIFNIMDEDLFCMESKNEKSHIPIFAFPSVFPN